MIAVLRHELASYFSSMTAYVFGAFLLLFGGIYTMSICLTSQIGNYEYVFSNTTSMFLIIVPILTMRVIAEERRQKTDQLLYSLPVSMTGVVVGKYLAMLVVLLIPTVIMTIYPLVLSAYGDVYIPEVMSAAVGFFLLGAALLSIGMFVSSLTESQAVAAGVCFAVMFLNYYLSSLASFVPSTAVASYVAFAVLILVLGVIVWLMTKSSFAGVAVIVVLEVALTLLYQMNGDVFAGLFPAVMSSLSLFDRFYVFVTGIFDLSGVVYLMSVCGIFVFLSVQSMEKRRWS